MPRPPALPADNIVDAEVCARAGSSIARRYSAADLPRLNEAGGREGSSVEVNFQFSSFDARPAVAGELHGAVTLTCQRCMQPVSVELDDSFQVLIVAEERDDEPGGYEPVIANATRLDLRWLAEEQTLLALPLVPMHEDQDCASNVAGGIVTGNIAAGVNQGANPVMNPVTNAGANSAAAEEADADGAADIRQQPFRNLRDLLRKQ